MNLLKLIAAACTICTSAVIAPANAVEMLKYGAVYDGCVEGCMGQDNDQEMCRRMCNCWVDEINRRGYADEYARSVFTGPTQSIMAKNLEIAEYCTGNGQESQDSEDSNDAVTAPKISVTSFSKQIDYGRVPAGFVPEIPEFDNAASIVINMDKSKADELVQIHVTKVPYRVADFNPADYSGDEFRMFEKDAANLQKQGQMAIQCSYRSARSVNIVQSVTFWYLTAPSNSTLTTFRKNWPNHPFLKIRNSVSNCPSTLQRALQASK